MKNTLHHTVESPTTAEEILNNSQSSDIYTKTNILGTPFDIIETQTDTFLALGRYKIVYPGYTKHDYTQAVQTRDWDLILDVIGICSQINQK